MSFKYRVIGNGDSPQSSGSGRVSIYSCMFREEYKSFENSYAVSFYLAVWSESPYSSKINKGPTRFQTLSHGSSVVIEDAAGTRSSVQIEVRIVVSPDNLFVE